MFLGCAICIHPPLYRKILFTASQCIQPGFSRNCATVDVANAMSGRVPTAVYIREPTASRYGTYFIFAFSASVEGDWDFTRGFDGSIGIDEGFKSSKLNRVTMASM
jgi:hypothetical protein